MGEQKCVFLAEAADNFLSKGPDSAKALESLTRPVPIEDIAHLDRYIRSSPLVNRRSQAFQSLTVDPDDALPSMKAPRFRENPGQLRGSRNVIIGLSVDVQPIHGSLKQTGRTFLADLDSCLLCALAHKRQVQNGSVVEDISWDGGIDVNCTLDGLRCLEELGGIPRPRESEIH